MVCDETLIVRSKDQNFQAYEELVKRYENLVFNFASRLLLNMKDADDVLQATFLRAYVMLKDFHFKHKFAIWLFRITYSVCLTKLKPNRYSKMPSILQSDVFEMTLLDKLNCIPLSSGRKNNSKKLSYLLERALLTLGPQNRAIFILKDLEGLTSQEISVVTSYSIESIKTRLHNVRLTLRELLFENLEPCVSLEENQDVVASSYQC